MKKKRLQWVKAHKNWTVEDWKKILFSDDSLFFFGLRKAQPICQDQQELTAKSCNFNKMVEYHLKMFWVCFSYSGGASLLPIKVMMNLDKYKDVLENKVIPDMRSIGVARGPAPLH